MTIRDQTYIYLAACYSKLEKFDSASHYLTKALDLGLRSDNVDQIDADNNLDKLIKSKYWAPLRRRLVENSKAKPPGDETLGSILLEKGKLDQLYRVTNQMDENTLRLQEKIDLANQNWLDSIVDARGWPTASLVGEEASINAWLIVQHADKNTSFQKKCLEKMRHLIKRSEIRLSTFAYLVDRVLVNDCKPQLYGTQYSLIMDEQGKVKSLEFKPIDESEWVDKRRRYMNMIPLEDYRSEALGHHRSR